MKKEYINPEICVIELQHQGILCGSQVTSLDPDTNPADLDLEDDGFDDIVDDM
jgi:hypothetical protein